MDFNPYLVTVAASSSRIAAIPRIHKKWIVILAIMLGMGVPYVHRWAAYEAGYSVWLLVPPCFIVFVALIRPVFSTVVSTILTVVFADQLYSIDVPWVYIGPPFDPDYKTINCVIAISCSSVSVAAAIAYFIHPTLLPSWQKKALDQTPQRSCKAIILNGTESDICEE